MTKVTNLEQQLFTIGCSTLYRKQDNRDDDTDNETILIEGKENIYLQVFELQMLAKKLYFTERKG